MKTLIDYIDRAKEKSGSDYATAKALGVTRQAISLARTGRGMTPTNCVRLAEYLEVDPLEVIAASEVTKNPENKAVWQRWAVTAALILGILVLDINVGNQALAMAPATVELYIMRYHMRWHGSR